MPYQGPALATSSVALALVLCLAGIFGVVSFTVQQRTREFGLPSGTTTLEPASASLHAGPEACHSRGAR